MCATCGSLAQCPHDLEDEDADVLMESKNRDPSALPLGAGPLQRRRIAQASVGSVGGAEPVSSTARSCRVGTVAPTRPEPDENTDTFDMVTNLVVSAGAEVFNTYGEHLTNAQLLARYGFALDGNENDCVNFDQGDLPCLSEVTPRRLVIHRDTVLGTYRRVLAVFPGYARWAVSGLVYQPDSDSSGSTPAVVDGGLGQAYDRDGIAAHMIINSDARVSHALWLYCAVVAILDAWEADAHEPDACAVAAAARRLACSQLFFESRSETFGGMPPDAYAYDDEGRGDLPRHEGTEEADKVRFIHRPPLFSFLRGLLARVRCMISHPAIFMLSVLVSSGSCVAHLGRPSVVR